MTASGIVIVEYAIDGGARIAMAVLTHLKTSIVRFPVPKLQMVTCALAPSSA